MLLKILITICLLFSLTGCARDLGRQTLDKKIDLEVSRLQTELNLNRQSNGKYKKLPDKIVNGIKYRTDEYETAYKDIGYWITITKENNQIWQKVIATGILKSELEHDWIYIADVYKSSTSTTKSL